MRSGIGRLNLDGPAERLLGLLKLAEGELAFAAVEMRAGVFRVRGDRFLQPRDSFLVRLVNRIYAPTLQFALRRRGLVLGAAAVATAATVCCSGRSAACLMASSACSRNTGKA